MIRLDNKLRPGRHNWWIRSVGFLALIATLSLWNLGAQHATEHGPLHESSPCGTCLAVATEGVTPPAGDSIRATLAAHRVIAPRQPQPASAQRAFRLSARVVGVEPNGNLIIAGYQQTQVSNEVRYLTVSGVIRAQDITRTNTVSYEKIADANLSYLSRGETMAGMKRGLVPRVLETVLPF